MNQHSDRSMRRRIRLFAMDSLPPEAFGEDESRITIIIEGDDINL